MADDGRLPVLEAKGFSVKRGGALVIENASFTIQRGDYVGVVGPNGSGKTTLLLALLGIIPKDGGTVKFFGKDIKSFNDWDRVAYVGQHAANFDNTFPLTVRELVGLGRAGRRNIGRRLGKDDWGMVDKALDFMSISDIAHKRIGDLSGGQKQRVFVAKALVRDPEILLLDEPVGGVDATTLEKFYRTLSDLNIQKGMTIILVSHDLAAVFCRMSKVMCVNRDVHFTEITDDTEPNDVLKKVYGDHFHFVFHRHQCDGVFDDE